MRYLLIILLFLAACNNKKQPAVVVDPVTRDTIPQVDDFGLKPTDFNITQREYVFADKGRKVKDPPLPPPPPSPVYSPPGVILLDFDGHTVTGTMWGTTIIATPSGMSIEEQQIALDTTAARVARYKFNAIVTTSDSVYNKSPANKRVRCIITEHYTWFGQAGGASFVGSINWGDNTPCFVFSLLLNYNLKMIYEAIFHEVGHTMGLYHQSVYNSDCIKTSEYNYGNAAFAPFMGVGYYSATVGPIVGTSSRGCTIIQNDTLVIKNALK